MRMKKTGVIILTVFYFIVASGFAVNMHFCAGKLKTISLMHEDDCCCGSKKKTKGCCEEKTIVCKINDNQKLDSKTTVPDISVKELSAYFVLLHFLVPQNLSVDHIIPPDTSPPYLFSDQHFLVNRNFRIWFCHRNRTDSQHTLSANFKFKNQLLVKLPIE